MNPEVVTLGECLVLLYPAQPVPLEDADRFKIDIAGAESNLAIALARLGHPVRFISRVGQDPFGRRIRQVLEREGVSVDALRVDPTAPTGVFFREWLPDGARRVYYYRAGSAASRLAPDDLRADMFAGARLVVLSGITPALSPSCAATIVRAIELARANRCLVAFDPNYRPALWDAATASATLTPLMRQSDILLIGHEDARAIFGGADDETTLARAAELGARIVILKRGERGAVALAENQRVHVPAFPVAQVVDPVGAGDGFNAGFLAGWLRGQNLKESLRLGAKVGAAAVATAGDYAGYPRSPLP